MAGSDREFCRRDLLKTLGGTVVFGVSTAASGANGSYFAVSANHEPAVLEKGETGVLNGVVENTGDEADEQTIIIEAEFNGTPVIDSQQVALEPGEKETVTETREYDEYPGEGDYVAEACSDDDCDTTTWTLGEVEFTVTIDDVTEPTAGNPLTVTATIKNIRNGPASQDITLDIDGTQRDSQEVRLDDDETETVTLTWETDVDDAGEYTATVASRDNEVITPVTVEEPATVDVDIVNANAPVEEGEKLAIETAAENTDTEATTQTITLSAAGTEQDSTAVTLDPGDTVTRTLTWQTERGDAGDRTVTVGSETDTVTAAYTIEFGDRSLADYAGEDGVIGNDGLTDAIGDWQAGNIETTLVREVIDYWETRDTVE